jgi:hypothetical protein
MSVKPTLTESVLVLVIMAGDAGYEGPSIDALHCIPNS